MYYLSLKFPTSYGIAELTNNVREARECYIVMMQATSSASTTGRAPVVSSDGSSPSQLGHPVLILDALEMLFPEKTFRLETGEEVKNIVLDEDYPHRVIKIGRGLPKETQEALTTLVREFKFVFAWSDDNVPSIPHELMVHRLNVDPRAKPVQQKRDTSALSEVNQFLGNSTSYWLSE